MQSLRVDAFSTQQKCEKRVHCHVILTAVMIYLLSVMFFHEKCLCNCVIPCLIGVKLTLDLRC